MAFYEKLVELAIKIHGRISDETCKLFEEKNEKSEFSFDLGQCIENAFLQGSANDFYLKAFEKEERSMPSSLLCG